MERATAPSLSLQLHLRFRNDSGWHPVRVDWQQTWSITG